jgi:hypothetical protein
MSSLTSYNGLSVLTPEPSAAGGKAINDNFKALSTAQETSDPGSSNDNTEGYSVGSRWINTTTGVEWLCTSSATGAATWVAMVPTLEQVTTAGASSDKAVTLSNGLSLSGSTFNMNDGSGSGGGTFNLDQGTLNFDANSSIGSDGSGHITIASLDGSITLSSFITFDLGGCQITGASAYSGTSVVLSNWVTLNTTKTTVSGSTSGTATFSQPIRGSAYKKVVIYLSSLVGTATYTFSPAFTNAPIALGPNASLATGISTTSVTVTGSTSTGFIILEGY